MQKITPILFSTPMVQAILEGRKTMTRRICKHKLDDRGYRLTNYLEDYHGNKIKQSVEIGDILWVREAFSESDPLYEYRADYGENVVGHGWRPSLFMPKQACRIWLEVTNVRLERLQDISEMDAIAEGLESCVADLSKFGARAVGMKLYRDYGRKNNSLKDYPCNGFEFAKISFETLWQSINGANSWEENPWVWVYEFKQVEMPINFLN
jgi:hypothetical protein